VPLFSDAASAILLEKTGDHPAWTFLNGSDGRGKEAIWIPEGGFRQAFTYQSLEFKSFEQGIRRRPIDLILNGIDVYQFAVKRVTAQLLQLLHHKGLQAEEVDHLILHQANLLINESIRKRTGFSDYQVIQSLHDLGNSGAASIPVTFAHHFAQTKPAQPLKMIFSGFGVGLSWASVYAEWSPPEQVLWLEYPEND